MSATLTHDKKKLGGVVDKVQSNVDNVIDKLALPPSKLAPAGPRSAMLTAQWMSMRKSVLLNPKGLRRLSLTELIQESRK